MTWNFQLAPGAIAYRISRSAAITEKTELQPRQEISTNSTFESLTLQPAGDTIGFTAVVDTFSTTTQGAVAPLRSVQLPFQLSGSRIGDSIVFSTDSLTQICDPAISALVTDLHNILPHFPTTLMRSMNWKDSTRSLGCQGSIPTRSRTLHSYQVVGENTYGGFHTLVIQRNDTIQAEGEGTQQQHHLTLTAGGTGKAVYYLDTTSGRIIHLRVDQDLDISVTASGKTGHFRQTTTQEFALVR